MERDSQNRGESSRRPSAKDWALGLGMGIRKRLLGDPAGISYGAADFPYASTATPSLLHSRQEQMYDADRAMRIHRTASSAHTRAYSRTDSVALNAEDRLHTQTKEKGANQAGDFRVIDTINETSRYLERENNKFISMREQIAVMYTVLTVTGLVTGVIGVFLDDAVEYLTSLRTGICTSSFFLTEHLCCLSSGEGDCPDFLLWGGESDTKSYMVNLGFAVIYGFSSAFLVKRFAPYAAGSGIPEIKAVLNGCVMRGYLSGWTMVVKILGLTLSVAAGLNLGKEGPVVHLACCVAFLTANCFKLFRYNETSIRDVLSCACAAGVATAFGAPVGGILFAYEEASTYFPNHVLWRAFFCATVAALVLRWSNPFFDGSLVMFRVKENVQWYWFELLPIAVVGILGGFIGYLWIKLNLQWMKIKMRNSWFRRSPIIETICLVFLTVSANWVFPFLRQTNSSLLSTLFAGCSSEDMTTSSSWSDLLCHNSRKPELITILTYGVIQKFLLSALTFGSRVPAGLFIPSLTVGSMFGTLVGMGVHTVASSYPEFFLFRDCTSATFCAAGSVYAIVGAASVLAGVTQVSVSLAVIMLELTDRLNLLLPLMITILLAKMVTNFFGTPSIYDSYVHMKRYPYLEPGAIIENELADASRVMSKKVICIPATGTTIHQLEELYKTTKTFGFPIVEDLETKQLVGYLARIELKVALQTAKRHTGVDANTPCA
mmetsp:Transcript_19840/g.79113  ORF Transcript_19840/g.79113 Transcript_19840/m.79113 type:complete len:718 (+) Transcript_19840:175-2328(+)